jgi:hypothetical protein
MESKNTLDSRSGIKLLLSMKGHSNTYINEYNDNNPFSSNASDDEEYNNMNCVAEITDEEYNNAVKDMDNLIMNLIKTKQKLRLKKLKDKLKTKEDFLQFMGVKDGNENFIPPEPLSVKSSDCRSSEYTNKFKINTNSKQNNEFSQIKEKLMKQEKSLKDKEETFIIHNNINNESLVTIPDDTLNSQLFQTNYTSDEEKSYIHTHNMHNNYNNIINNDDDMNEIYAEIKRAELKCEDMLNDIDEYIKMGEDI